MWDFIAIPLGWLMELIYNIVKNYGIALLLFTIVTKILLLPLSIKQQKSMAKNSAYQPMINEINKKYAKDKQKQQEELMKMQQEFGYNPLVGCLPMVVQMVILFGLIQVIYNPLRFIIGIPKDVYTTIVTWGKATFEKVNYVDTAIIGAVQKGDTNVIEYLTNIFAENEIGDSVLTGIRDFNLDFFGIDLTRIPNITDLSSLASILLILVPVLSAATMILQTIIMQKVSGSPEMQGGMKYMPHMMSIMFIWIGFTVPAAVSLYWIFTNVFGLIQSLLLKKIYDPAKMKQALQDEIAAKKAAKREKKEVVVVEKSGAKVTKAVSENELANIRLARARELEKERYADSQTENSEK